jgi:hypothetical protein
MPYICEKCGFSCDSQTKLNTHLNKKTPCIFDENNENGIKCEFCTNSFSTKSSLNRHMDRCVVRKNPELLLKHIEHQKEIIQQKDEIIIQKDEIIEQKDELIEKLKVPGNEYNTGIKGDNNSVDNSIDNSTHIHIDKVVHQPLSFRPCDMEILIKRLDDIKEIAYHIGKHAKANDLPSSIGVLLSSIHGNPNIKDGQNIVYVTEGKYKGKLASYQQLEDGTDEWR